MNNKLRVSYEVFLMFVMGSYAVLVFASSNHHPWLTPSLVANIDIGMIIGFAIEYLIRLYFADRKLMFIVQNWFDLLALIPVSPHMVFARFVRLLRLLRILKTSPFIRTCFYNQRIRLQFVLLLAIILWSSAAFYVLEHGINSSVKNFGDALWWALITVSTVGYGDVYPITAAGRVVAVFLTLSSIIFVGMFAAEVVSHWNDFVHSSNDTKSTSRQKSRKTKVKKEIDRMEYMSEEMMELLITAMHGEAAASNETMQ